MTIENHFKNFKLYENQKQFCKVYEEFINSKQINLTIVSRRNSGITWAMVKIIQYENTVNKKHFTIVQDRHNTLLIDMLRQYPFIDWSLILVCNDTSRLYGLRNTILVFDNIHDVEHSNFLYNQNKKIFLKNTQDLSFYENVNVVDLNIYCSINNIINLYKDCKNPIKYELFNDEISNFILNEIDSFKVDFSTDNHLHFDLAKLFFNNNTNFDTIYSILNYDFNFTDNDIKYIFILMSYLEYRDKKTTKTLEKYKESYEN